MKDKLEFFKRPWAITRDAFEILAGYDFDRCEDSPALAEVSLEEFNEKLEVDELNGIAKLDISGPLMQNPSLLARFFMGAADLVRIEKLIRSAKSNPDVRALVLNMNTPGGTVTGTPEVGNAVADFVKSGKPAYVFSNGLVASAGYWIAAPATELVGTESSRWGSVGVIRPHVDLSEARRQAGIKVELFTSGKHKAAGAFATSLTEEQREEIKAEVERLGAKFREHVKEYRPDIDDEDLEALVYYADDAKAKGYLDRTVANYDEFIAGIIKKHGADSLGTAAQVDTVSTGEDQGDLADSETMKNETDNTEHDDELDTGAEVEGEVEDTASEGEGAPEGATDSADTSDDSTAEDIATESEAADTEDEVELTESEDVTPDVALANALNRIEVLEGKLEDFDAKVDEAAAKKAARFAAEASTDAADVTTEGDATATEESRFSSMSSSELWAEYEKIRGASGDAKASEFYKKHIEGRG
jgi:signal peptide peptidase SppA